MEYLKYQCNKYVRIINLMFNRDRIVLGFKRISS